MAFIFSSMYLLFFFSSFVLFQTNRRHEKRRISKVNNFWLRMASRTATNSLVKRTAFSSAINIFPNEVPPTGIAESENESTKNAHIRPYSEIPGPKGLPIIGNSWRFAPLIGKMENFFLFQFKWTAFIIKHKNVK